MAVKYDVATARGLEQRVREQDLLRRARIQRYEPGTELVYDVTGIVPAVQARVRVVVEKFVGGGFAGQVYLATIREIEGGAISGLSVGGSYAVKVLIPPSATSRLFRDTIYKIGFQAPFGLQVNSAAARAGALWQVFLQRGARLRFGDPRAIVDIYGTFVDPVLGACGEIREWVEGRNWRFEVDDHLDLRKKWAKGKDVPAEKLGSPEYRAKRQFMRDIVKLFHDMGAPELARQYYWATCKSQPNAMKRMDCEGDPAAGLTAVDFRAGLALLPFLPMSPGDFVLIGKGLLRGSLVQFDRGNVKKLQGFVDAHAADFADLRAGLEELKVQERAYRDSQIDVTHHHLRLLNPWRWGKILGGLVTSWQVRGMTDEGATNWLAKCKFSATMFALLMLLPLLGVAGGVATAIWCLIHRTTDARLLGAAAGMLVAVPLLAGFLRRLLGRGDYRRHYGKLLTSLGYIRRDVRAKVAEKALAWLRAGRVSAETARRIAEHPSKLLAHWPLSILPAGLHRMLTDWGVLKAKLSFVFVRPVRLFLDPKAREQWLREMIAEGLRKGMLTQEEAANIEARIAEPFIQKYLKSLAVHICTLPVTHVVATIVAIVYIVQHPELSWGQALAAGFAILAFFQVIPISPGSLTRGLYVVYLVIRERNVRDYNIALGLGFFKYIGYLSFPIQMAYRYPALARFMAAHWATGAVHVVPVFGEGGALLEHGVFDVFYNRPLTIRRRMRARAQYRAKKPARRWHVLPLAAAATAVFAVLDWYFLRKTGSEVGLRKIWYAVLLTPPAAGAFTTIWAGGASLWGRFKLAALCGILAAVLSAAWHAIYPLLSAGKPLHAMLQDGAMWATGMDALWRLFLLTLLAALGAMLTELMLPEPRVNRESRIANRELGSGNSRVASRDSGVTKGTAEEPARRD